MIHLRLAILGVNKSLRIHPELFCVTHMASDRECILMKRALVVNYLSEEKSSLIPEAGLLIEKLKPS